MVHEPRVIRASGDSLENTRRGAFPGRDAVRYSYTPIRVAGKSEPADRRLARFDARDTIEMPEMILRHRVLPAGDAHEPRLRGDAHRFTQFRTRQRDEVGVRATD